MTDLDAIRFRHQTHDDPETCDAECLELPEVMDAFTAQNDADQGLRRVLMTNELFTELGASKVEWGESDADGFYTPTVFAAPPAVDVHPGEPHEFRTICRRCQEPGMLHVSLIAPGEHVHIEPAGKPLASETDLERLIRLLNDAADEGWMSAETARAILHLAPPAVDVERLSEALDRFYHRKRPGEMRTHAEGIAAEYARLGDTR